MTGIFLSYMREDIVRAGQIARALEAEGFSISWDRPSQGGAGSESQEAFDQARCVLVLWSRASHGPAGGRVRDEATRAQARGILVPVRADKIAPSLVLPDVQTIDLADWRGSLLDPSFRDVVAAIRARIDRREPLPAMAPFLRQRRLVIAGASAGCAMMVGLLFGLNLFGVQDSACAIPSGHVVSDACGAVGLGNRPSKGERLAWESRPRGDCAALRAFAADKGHYYHRAAVAALNAVTETRADAFTPAPRNWLSRVPARDRPRFPTEAAAKEDARERAEREAFHEGCAPRAYERIRGVEITPREYECRREGRRGGFSCALSYHAMCRIEARAVVRRCG